MAVLISPPRLAVPYFCGFQEPPLVFDQISFMLKASRNPTLILMLCAGIVPTALTSRASEGRWAAVPPPYGPHLSPLNSRWGLAVCLLQPQVILDRKESPGGQIPETPKRPTAVPASPSTARNGELQP